MRKLLVIIIISSISRMTYAQCPPLDQGYLIFSSQEKLEAFAADFPNCTEIVTTNGLTIITNQDALGTPIHDLTPLSQIVKVEGGIRISLENEQILPNLESLNGLHNIVELDKLELSKSNAITGFSELLGIKKLDKLQVNSTSAFTEIGLNELHIEEELILWGNEALVSLDNLTTGDEIQNLTISDNPQLELADRLQNLEIVHNSLILNHPDLRFVKDIVTIGELNLTGNGPIQDLTAFESIQSLTSGLKLTSLENLENLQYLDNLINTSTFNTLSLNNLPILSDINIFENVKELGTLAISWCPQITDLTAMSDLARLGFMNLNDLEGLTDLQGLGKVSSGGTFIIMSNPNLETFDGLEGLLTLNDLRILGNENLYHIDGLSNLAEMHKGFSISNSLMIIGNPNLESIMGLSGMYANLGLIRITNNPELTICHLPFICNHILLGKQTDLRNNGPGCQSIKETEDQCNAPVFQKIYLDQNENGTDNSEPGIPIGYTVYNEDIRLFPNQHGIISLSPFDGNIDLEYQVQDNWEATNQTSFNFPDSDNVDAMRIGLTPTVELNKLDMYLNYGNIVCDQLYDMILTLKNTGTTILNTEVTVIGSGKFISATREPISINEEEVVFLIEDILPGQTKEILMFYHAPNIVDIPLGSELNLGLKGTLYDVSDNIIKEQEKFYASSLLCAYDPNDKQVFPAGVGEDNKTLKSEELQYLIRFQNTGNYYAEDIVIRDTFDGNLDLNTFQFISASHPISEIRMERNALAFVFENIFLPDSTRNEPESHGYVSYSISAKPDIPENTVIANTAFIYFDSNPAIVTNTTSNNMVTSLDNGSSITETTTSAPIKVYPNPASTHIFIKGEAKLGKWQLTDTNGQKILTGHSEDSELFIDVSRMTSGLYFIIT